MRDWVVMVESSEGLWIALLRSYLEGAGVKTWVENEHTHAIFGVGMLSSTPANSALGPMRLWVPRAQADKAHALVEEFFSL
ncbi:MAG: DUF2007 domain-containing protein [Bacteroidia bacterium]|nr:DUF2007 domain-containing protein [Bacteroidia bacterium]MCX7651476.1 DUF2007 domain-containing protein [Bacteroidia bacterium]MDW8416769.1 DUF2007 domain-containing protein [Bacteroidia bacterium]